MLLGVHVYCFLVRAQMQLGKETHTGKRPFVRHKTLELEQVMIKFITDAAYA